MQQPSKQSNSQNQQTSCEPQNLTFEELSSTEQNLLLKAEHALSHSYAPYSGFHVASAGLGQTQTKEKNRQPSDIIIGVNYESASYGLTICAERAMLANAQTAGIQQISSIAIIAHDTNLMATQKKPLSAKHPAHKKMPSEPIVPCGACRQILAEYAHRMGKNLILLLSNADKTVILKTSIAHLLPHAFLPALAP